MAKTIKQIDAEILDCGTKMQSILDVATEKTNGKLSAEQKTEYDALDATYDELITEKQELAEAVKRQQKLADRAKKSGELSGVIGKIPERITQPDQLATTTDVRVVENLTTYTLAGGEVVKKPKFHRLGDQLQAIAQAGRSGQDNPMLCWEQLAVATGGAAAGVPSDGGYLIQKDFASELYSRMSAAGSLASFPVRSIPITNPNSDGLELVLVNETSRAAGSRWGGVQVDWGAEGDAATAKKPSFRKETLELKELIGLAYATNKLLADAGALESVFLQAFSEEMSFMKEDARINGTGAGQPKGIISTTGATATVSVAKETGQAAATVVYENIVKMYSRLWSRSRQNSIWIINQDVEPSLMTMTIAVGTGGVPVYLQPGGAAGTPYGTLLGRPVVPVEYCATLGTVGDIILWDPTQYIEITKGGMQADQSVHVRFTTNENTFRFITRVDGMPMWNSPLSPFKGSSTQSPQVTLQTRA
ncbi:MAG TPA: phage major capsid protein [Pirellulales bacterium]|nr:phage major capsid protein [Pirellulales bacterium]